MSEQGLESRPVWLQNLPRYSLYWNQKVMSKEERVRQERGAGNCKHLYFPKLWFTRLKTIRITEVECWSTGEPKKEFQRISLTGDRKSAFSPRTGKIWTKRNNEAVAWRKVIHQEGAYLRTRSRAEQTYIVCLLCASCQATALDMVSCLHVLKRNHKTQVRERIWIQNHEGEWAGRIEATPGMLALSVPQLRRVSLSLRPTNPTPSPVIVRTVSMFKALNCNFLFNNWKLRTFLRRSSPWDGRMRRYPGY